MNREVHVRILWEPEGVTTQYPRFFAHWEWTTGIPTFW